MRLKLLMLSLLVQGLYSLSCLAQELPDEATANQYFVQGNYEKAAIAFEKLFQTTYDDQHFEYYLSSLIKLKQFEKAESVIHKLRAQYPKKILYELGTGRIYLENGKIAEANALFDTIINNLKGEEQEVRQLASYFFRFEAYDQAIQTFLKCRKLLRDPAAFNFELISVYRYKKDGAALITEYLQTLQQLPNMGPQAKSAFSSVFDEPEEYLPLQAALQQALQKATSSPSPKVASNASLKENNPHPIQVQMAYQELMIWQYLQRKAYDTAVETLIGYEQLHQARFKNQKQPDSTRLAQTNYYLNQIFQLGQICLSNKALPAATKAFDYILQKGSKTPHYIDARMYWVNAQFELTIAGKFQPAEIEKLADAYQAIYTEYGKNLKTLYALQRWAYLQTYYLKDLTKARQGLEECLKIPGLLALDEARLKLELGDIYVMADMPWEAALIYEQVSKQYDNQSIGNDAKFKSAKLNFFLGDFKYAQSLTAVLRLQTQQLIANDALNLNMLIQNNSSNPADSLALLTYAKAKFMLFKNKPDSSLLLLNSLLQNNPASSLADAIQMSKAEIYINQKAFNLAIQSYQSLINDYPQSLWFDDALFKLAELFELEIQNKAQAQQYYERLIFEFPESLYLPEARTRFRKLRGN